MKEMDGCPNRIYTGVDTTPISQMLGPYLEYGGFSGETFSDPGK